MSKSTALYLGEADCDDCGETLAAHDALFYDGAVLSCRACRSVSQVSADSEGMHLHWLAGPCYACGALTDDGGPCAPFCGASTEEKTHVVIL